MITASGRVVAIAPGAVWVETIRRGSCQACSARQGCGHGLLAMAGSSQGASALRVRADLGAFTRAPVQLNDEVQIAIAERAMVAGVAWVYLLPLLCMLLALAVGSRWGEAVAALAALAGLLLGFGLLRWHAAARAHAPAYRPVVIAVLPFRSADEPPSTAIDVIRCP